MSWHTKYTHSILKSPKVLTILASTLTLTSFRSAKLVICKTQGKIHPGAKLLSIRQQWWDRHRIDIPTPKGINFKEGKGPSQGWNLLGQTDENVTLENNPLGPMLYPLGSLGWPPHPLSPGQWGFCPLKPRRWLHPLKLRTWPHLQKLRRRLPNLHGLVSSPPVVPGAPAGFWIAFKVNIHFSCKMTHLHLGRSQTLVGSIACGTPEVWEPSFISSWLCPSSLQAGNVSFDINFS